MYYCVEVVYCPYVIKELDVIDVIDVIVMTLSFKKIVTVGLF